MLKYLITLTAFFAFQAVSAEKKTNSFDPVPYVNTLQGTNSHFGLSHGNTFPATAMPFAQHMWTPQTGPNGEGFKYLYPAEEIRGFGQSHQCSPWVSDYAVYTFFPEVGKLEVDPDKRPAKFSHKNEVGQPHYYSVLFDNGIQTEFAPTDRGVHFRFSYPKTGDAWLIIDGYTAQSQMEIDVQKRQVRGWVNNQRFVNHSENFRNYFMFMNDDMNLILKFIQERMHIIMSSLLGLSISMFISNIMSINNSDILFIMAVLSSVSNK